MKTTQLSTRVSPEDAAFLAELVVEGATTPSDKLRALITDARRRREELGSYEGSLRQVRDLIGPASARVLALESEGIPHSQIVSPVIDWLTECLAFLLSHVPHQSEEPRERLEELESGLADRSFRLVDAMLKLGVTKNAPCYDPQVAQVHLDRALQVARVIDAARTAAANHGEAQRQPEKFD